MCSREGVSTEALPVHFANVLHVLQMHDRFENTFERWSMCRQRDRQQFVVTLLSGATLVHPVINTICMMYPRRLVGPFLCGNTLTFEFLDEFTAFERGALADLRKRKRSPTDSDGGAVDTIAKIGSSIASCLKELNHSSLSVTRTNTGEDSDGTWASFELSECDRLNLSFTTDVLTGPCSGMIKVYLSRTFPPLSLPFSLNCPYCRFLYPPNKLSAQCLRIQTGAPVSIHLKLYKAGDRRVISGWDIVPVYRMTGNFTAVRSWRKGCELIKE